MDAGLRQRVERLESIREIKRLSFAYAQAIDARDMDALASLYVEDYADETMIGDRRGREALKYRLSRIVRLFTTSMHLVGTQVIHMDDEEHAHGVVFTRAEHEVGELWVIMALHYWDTYERRDGRWYFKYRRPQRLYTSELLERPAGPLKSRWPGLPPADTPVPAGYPSWGEFWARIGKWESLTP